jgi:hypothetical protein
LVIHDSGVERSAVDIFEEALNTWNRWLEEWYLKESSLYRRQASEPAVGHGHKSPGAPILHRISAKAKSLESLDPCHGSEVLIFATGAVRVTRPESLNRPLWKAISKYRPVKKPQFQVSLTPAMYYLTPAYRALVPGWP